MVEAPRRGRPAQWSTEHGLLRTALIGMLGSALGWERDPSQLPRPGALRHGWEGSETAASEGARQLPCSRSLFMTCVPLCLSQAVTLGRPGCCGCAVSGWVTPGIAYRLMEVCITSHPCWDARAALTGTGLGLWRGTQTLFWWECAATICCELHTQCRMSGGATVSASATQ